MINIEITVGVGECLSQLTSIQGLSQEVFQGNPLTMMLVYSIEQFFRMKDLCKTYFTLVIENTDHSTIVAMGTLVVELKFIRGGASVNELCKFTLIPFQAGHIEDIVVLSTERGKNFGRM